MVNIRDSITLKACRVIADIRAEDMASALDITVDTLYKWEQGRSYPNIAQLKKIIQLLADKGYKAEMNDIYFF